MDGLKTLMTKTDSMISDANKAFGVKPDIDVAFFKATEATKSLEGFIITAARIESLGFELDTSIMTFVKNRAIVLRDLLMEVTACKFMLDTGNARKRNLATEN